MNCPECGHPMSEQEVIRHLQRKIERLEAELWAEKSRPMPLMPYPCNPLAPWTPTWTAPNADTPPRPDYEITCGDPQANQRGNE